MYIPPPLAAKLLAMIESMTSTVPENTKIPPPSFVTGLVNDPPLLLMSVRMMVSVPLLLKTPPPKVAVFPVMTISVSVRLPALLTAPPAEPVRVTPEMLAVALDEAVKMLPFDALPGILLIVNNSAPGPAIVMFFSILMPPEKSAIVVGIEGLKVIVLPAQASATACLSVPGPESDPLMTTGFVVQTAFVLSDEKADKRLSHDHDSARAV